MRILLVDDEKLQRETLGAILSDHGYQVVLAEGVKEARGHIKDQSFEVVLSDFKMPDGTGLDLVESIRGSLPEAVVFMMTAYADVQSVIASMRLGVLDYLLKPIHVESLLRKLKLLEEHRELQLELKDLRTRLTRTQTESLLGESEPIQEIMKTIRKVAETKGTVLITGESGTGKEVAARMIHNVSADRSRKFVAVNCAAIPENLLESELFGHKRGSFTGATLDKDGFFKVASGGTIFLDEIGELPKSLQAKLLRVLQEREITPIGETKPVKIDVRIIAATNRDLSNDIAAGNFRQDLYYRINVVNITMPSLRDHPEDIPVLVMHFIEKFAKQFHKKPMRVSNDAIKVLKEYQWPGNVRELENVVERAMILKSSDEVLDVEHLPANFQALKSTRASGDEASPLSLDGAIASFSRRHIQKVLESVKYDKKEAAKILGLGLSSLYRKIDELNISVRPPHDAAKSAF